MSSLVDASGCVPPRAQASAKAIRFLVRLHLLVRNQHRRCHRRGARTLVDSKALSVSLFRTKCICIWRTKASLSMAFTLYNSSSLAPHAISLTPSAPATHTAYTHTPVFNLAPTIIALPTLDTPCPAQDHTPSSLCYTGTQAVVKADVLGWHTYGSASEHLWRTPFSSAAANWLPCLCFRALGLTRKKNHHGTALTTRSG